MVLLKQRLVTVQCVSEEQQNDWLIQKNQPRQPPVSELVCFSCVVSNKVLSRQNKDGFSNM